LSSIDWVREESSGLIISDERKKDMSLESNMSIFASFCFPTEVSRLAEG
jgi:hypothetical protein